MDLTEARIALEQYAPRFPVLGRLARGEFRNEDLGELAAAASQLGARELVPYIEQLRDGAPAVLVAMNMMQNTAIGRELGPALEDLGDVGGELGKILIMLMGRR